MKPTEKEKVGYLQLKVGENYGNCIYTTATGGNLLYKAIKNKTLNLSRFSPRITLGNSFEVINIIGKFLKENNIEYYRGSSRHEVID